MKKLNSSISKLKVENLYSIFMLIILIIIIIIIIYTYQYSIPLTVYGAFYSISFFIFISMIKSLTALINYVMINVENG